MTPIPTLATSRSIVQINPHASIIIILYSCYMYDCFSQPDDTLPYKEIANK